MLNTNLIAYSGMTTKIRAMKKNLISPAQYEEITHITSVPELINYLRTLPSYAAVLSDLNTGDVHRGEVESRMTFSTYSDFSKIYHFAGNNQKHYLEYYFMKYEISTLKACMRNIMDSRTDTIPVLVDKHFKRHSKLNIDKLISSVTMDEFLENLSGTVYEKPLKKVLKMELPTLFDFEIALDLFFFSYVWNRRDLFVPKGEINHFVNSFGVQIDLLNILWIYRCKNYYTVSPAQIYSFLIPVYCNIDRSLIKKLVETKDNKELFDLIRSCYYGKNYSFDPEQSMESQFGAIMHTIYLKDFKESPYSLTAINAYFHLKNVEVAKVVTAMECIRYGYQPAMIAQYINQKRGVL